MFRRVLSRCLAIQQTTQVHVIDGSGAKVVKVIAPVQQGPAVREGRVGGEFSCSVKATAQTSLKQRKSKGFQRVFIGEVKRGLLVTCRKQTHRPSGIRVSFAQNTAILIDKEKKEPLSSIKYPMQLEVKRRKYPKVLAKHEGVLF
eukprot:TRINITY_DN68991_c0_g1_i1.p1 TRINITY_DN68991_c0_g1~~TRINITY_DN68991_c0_g1_i1.p1  ORF type:complete len:145 (+),score=9.87 TRINITY_DN68991_c0_g1_i1:26-460(+)